MVLVLNKVDLLRAADDPTEVMGFVRQHATALLGSAPEIFPISARFAQRRARAGSGDEGVQLWESSRLGVAARLSADNAGRRGPHPAQAADAARRDGAADDYATLDEAAKRQALLDEDARTVENIETQLAAHNEEMTRAFEQRLSAVQTLCCRCATVATVLR